MRRLCTTTPLPRSHRGVPLPRALDISLLEQNIDQNGMPHGSRPGQFHGLTVATHLGVQRRCQPPKIRQTVVDAPLEFREPLLGPLQCLVDPSDRHELLTDPLEVAG